MGPRRGRTANLDEKGRKAFVDVRLLRRFDFLARSTEADSSLIADAK